jgi:hypothetical protein
VLIRYRSVSSLAVNEAPGPSHGVTPLAGGYDHDAVVRRVLEIQKSQQGARQFGTVWRGLPQDVSCTAVVVAAVAAVQAGAAYGIGGGDTCQDSEAGCDVEVFVPVAFA